MLYAVYWGLRLSSAWWKKQNDRCVWLNCWASAVCCILRTVRKNAGKARVFKAVGEEGREMYNVRTDREREVHQGC